MALCQDADGRLLAEKQLQGFHLAAQMQLSKEALMSYWGSGQGLEAGGDQHSTALGAGSPRAIRLEHQEAEEQLGGAGQMGGHEAQEGPAVNAIQGSPAQ